MRRWLAVLAALLAVVTVTVWVITGASRGFTKTSVAVEKTDEITGLTYREYERRFVAGAELLALGLGLSAALVGVSRFCRPRNFP
jgi:hypothetical protein